MLTFAWVSWRGMSNDRGVVINSDFQFLDSPYPQNVLRYGQFSLALPTLIPK